MHRRKKRSHRRAKFWAYKIGRFFEERKIIFGVEITWLGWKNSTIPEHQHDAVRGAWGSEISDLTAKLEPHKLQDLSRGFEVRAKLALWWASRSIRSFRCSREGIRILKIAADEDKAGKIVFGWLPRIWNDIEIFGAFLRRILKYSYNRKKPEDDQRKSKGAKAKLFQHNQIEVRLDLLSLTNQDTNPTWIRGRKSLGLTSIWSQQ